jgi:CheY-like chemotaxis protein
VVLVVDDEEIVRNLARKMLGKMGFSVLEAGNGREGIEIFRQHADRIRFVLLDMTMPEMGGEETFYGLRLIKPDARILLTSGYHEQPFATDLANDQLVKFLKKPFNMATLMERIRQFSFTPVGKQ